MEPTTTTGDVLPPSLLPAMGEQCVACAAPLAADQRYCVECGERRGQPRFPFMDGRARPASKSARAPRRSRRPPWSPGGTLIAGVATLLIALGVGVLIGRSGNPGTSSAPVQVVTVAGAAAGAAAPTSTTAVPDTTTAGTSKTKKKSPSGASKAPTKSAATAPAVVKIGSKGSGRGYKNGKFTGDFFGP